MRKRKLRRKTNYKKISLCMSAAAVMLVIGLKSSTNVFGQFSEKDDALSSENIDAFEASEEEVEEAEENESTKNSDSEDEKKTEEDTSADTSNKKVQETVKNEEVKKTEDKVKTEVKKNEEVKKPAKQENNSGARYNNTIRYHAQDDYAYANNLYSVINDSSQTIEASGCGPSSFAIVASTLNNTEILPPEMCNYAIQTGCRKARGGTSSELFKIASNDKNNPKYNLNCSYLNSTESVKKALSDGNHLVIASMNPGHVTEFGHYIVFSGYRVVNGRTYFEVYDPHSRNEYYVYDSELIDEVKEDGFILLSEQAVKNEAQYYYGFSKK